MFKLYDIVIVKKDGYKHYGEVLSLPTPDQTLMVRRVPGHPGTLEELKIDTLESTDRKVKWVHYAEVSGFGQFPVDMLRYDFASPLNFEIVETFVGPRAGPVEPSFGFEKLVVAHCSHRSTPEWTEARWESFLWRGKHLKSELIQS